ncbi:MAG: hypothetical protein IKE91_03835 [Clostridia bacterium]|nr:hypothetical protein [Clostridia bacterium]
MNKEELIAFIESLNLPTEEFCVLSSGCLVLYGLRDVAGDLDLCVTPKLGDELIRRYNLTEKDKWGNNFYHVNDDLEFIIEKNFEFEKVGKYQVETLANVLKFKKARQKKRDLEDVANIERYLESLKK